MVVKFAAIFSLTPAKTSATMKPGVKLVDSHKDRRRRLVQILQSAKKANPIPDIAVADHLLPNGRFVFNIFSKSKRFVSKEYYIDNRRYNEISIKLFNKIIHIQKMSKIGSQLDITVFKYINRDEFFNALLGAGFNTVKVISEGNSAYYICSKEVL